MATPEAAPNRPSFEVIRHQEEHLRDPETVEREAAVGRIFENVDRLLEYEGRQDGVVSVISHLGNEREYGKRTLGHRKYASVIIAQRIDPLDIDEPGASPRRWQLAAYHVKFRRNRPVQSSGPWILSHTAGEEPRTDLKPAQLAQIESATAQFGPELSRRKTNQVIKLAKESSCR